MRIQPPFAAAARIFIFNLDHLPLIFLLPFFPKGQL